MTQCNCPVCDRVLKKPIEDLEEGKLLTCSPEAGGCDALIGALRVDGEKRMGAFTLYGEICSEAVAHRDLDPSPGSNEYEGHDSRWNWLELTMPGDEQVKAYREGKRPYVPLCI